MINPREAYGVEFINLDATLTYCLYVLLEKRLVVRVVSESIKESANLHAFLRFLCKQIEE